MVDYYGALGDKLSNTDPISNAVLISGLKFERDCVNLMMGGGYPLTCLGSYIHESLHHICFRSPVGAAISYLYHRAFIRAALCSSGEGTTVGDEYTILEDIVRVETILHQMRPLAEGIALFGEFDAWPGDAKSISSVFRNTALAFYKSVSDGENLRIDEILKSILFEMRSTDQFRHRKENLLMQGFTTSEGGYLPGYFMIKNLRLVLLRHVKSPLLMDSEFYLNFILHWFYSDYELVALLLDEAGKIDPWTKESMLNKDSINRISAHFQRRVGSLFNLTPEQIEAFDAALVSGKNAPWRRSQIGVTEERARSIENDLVQKMNDIMKHTEGGISETERNARARCHDNILRRNYMCVGSFDEEIEILENGRVHISTVNLQPDFPVMSFGGSEKEGPYKGRATFDVFQSGISQKIFFTVFADSERIKLHSYADGFETEKKQLAGVNLSTQHCHSLKNEMGKTIDATLKSDGTADIFRQHYRNEAERVTDEMYRNWCGALMSANGPEAVIPSADGAVLAMCGADTMFLRVLAALGCVSKPGLTDRDITTVCDSIGYGSEQFFDQLDEIERTHSFRLIYKIADYHMLVI